MRELMHPITGQGRLWLGDKNTGDLVTKGSIAPFDRVIDLSGTLSSEKLTQPYAKSLWVARAIKHVAEPVTAVPLRFSTERRGRDPIEDPELEMFWEEPATGPEGPVCLRDVVFATIGWLKLVGEAFWIFDDRVLINPKALPFPEAGLGMLPQFIIARPDRMRHVTERGGSTGRVIGWEYTDGAGGKHILLPEQVIHSKLWNPYDDIRGLGEYEQAKLAAESDYMGATFKLNLARNNGDQGVYIVAKSGIPDDIQRKQIVAQLREKREMQQRGMFKPVFLTGDISIEDPKVRVVDQAFNESMLQDATRIFIAFGVPPSMATVVASYSIGSASDYYRLIRDTCMPTGKLVSESVERATKMVGTTGGRTSASTSSKGRSGSRLFAWFDWSEHPVMKEVRKEGIESAVTLWDRGMSWETVNDMLDLGVPEFDGWEVAYLPFSVSPAAALQDIRSAEATAGADQEQVGTDATPSENNSEDDQAIQAMLRALKVGTRSTASQIKSTRDPKEIALWKSHFAKRRAVAKLYLARFNKLLFELRAEVLRKIESVGTRSTASVTRAAAADFLFDLVAFRETLTVAMRGVSLNVLQTAGQQLFDEVAKDDPFKMPPARAQLFLAGRDNKLRDVADDVWTSIKGELQAGLDAGDSIRELGNRIRGRFNEMSRGRAETIAMTETSAAYGVARQEAMDQAGIQFKQWLTSGLPNVRATHAAANGQTVRIDERYQVGGDLLDHPGDPSGSPGEVINCHCVSIAVSAPEGEQPT